ADHCVRDIGASSMRARRREGLIRPVSAAGEAEGARPGFVRRLKDRAHTHQYDRISGRACRPGRYARHTVDIPGLSTLIRVPASRLSRRHTALNADSIPPRDHVRPRGNPSTNRLGLDPAVRAGRIGLSLPTDLPFDAWRRIGDQLGVINGSSAWWLGDWLVYGEKTFPGRYRLAVSRTRLSYKTLRNYAWVARNVPMSRRRDTLSLQHHAQVAALPGDEQERWLARAEREGWPQ